MTSLRIVFVLGLVAVLSGFASPGMALVIGLVFGVAFEHPFGTGSKRLSKLLLQASVVGLGFGMNLHEVMAAGRRGFFYTLLSISFTMITGMALGALFRVLEFEGSA